MNRLNPVILRFTGILLVVIGLAAAYYGPLEIYVFTLFSEGGRFHYGGFGVGSFWFAALVVQNLGYYIIAALTLPVGFGHLQVRRWALTLTRLYLWFWLGFGALLVGNLVTLLPAAFKLELSREVLVGRTIIVGTAALVFLVLAPVLLSWFYRRPGVIAYFETRDPNQYWTERTPFPVLGLLLLLLIMILVLHIAIFTQGIFPVFGEIIMGRPSVYVISLCILVLGILTFGVARRERWAWWGSVGTLAALSVSTLMSFSKVRFSDLIGMMDLPAYEMAFLGALPLIQDLRLVGLLVPPLLVALVLVLASKRYFWTAVGDGIRE